MNENLQIQSFVRAQTGFDGAVGVRLFASKMSRSVRTLRPAAARCQVLYSYSILLLYLWLQCTVLGINEMVQLATQ